MGAAVAASPSHPRATSARVNGPPAAAATSVGEAKVEAEAILHGSRSSSCRFDGCD